MVKREVKRKYFDIAPPPAKKAVKAVVDPEDRPSTSPPPNVTDDDDQVTDNSGDGFQNDTLMEPDEASQNHAIEHRGFTIMPVAQNSDQSEALPAAEPESGDGGYSIKVNKADSSAVADQTPLPEANAINTAKPESENATVQNTPDEAVLNSAQDTPTPVAPESAATPADDNAPSIDATEKVLPPDKDVSATVERFAVVDSLPDPGEKVTEVVQENMQNPKIYDTKEYYIPIGHAHHKHGSLKMAFIFGIICALAVVGAAVYVMYFMGK
jgi:hypothetical protein